MATKNGERALQVRFYEAQNKKLSEELAKLRESWGKETEKIKSLYDGELEQMRRLLEDSGKYKAGTEVKISALEDQISELQTLLEESNRHSAAAREAVGKLNQQLADCDSEISLLRRRVATCGEDRARDQAEVKRLRQEASRLRQDLDSETLSHINAENNAQSLREELEFQRVLHESELKELAALACRDTTFENREYWKAEMAQALGDIRREYDAKLDAARSEMESQYSLRVQENRASTSRDSVELTRLREENKRARAQVADIRGRIPEMEARSSQLERELDELRRESEESERKFELEKALLSADLAGAKAALDERQKELQVLSDAKLSLELEIHAYRKLLEGEENRLPLDVTESEEAASLVSNIIASEHQLLTESSTAPPSAPPPPAEPSQPPPPPPPPPSVDGAESVGSPAGLIKGEISARTTYQRTAKGNVGIQECSSDGKFVTLEYGGKKSVDLSNWTLVRNVDSDRQVIKFTFPHGTVIGASAKTIKIWAQGLKPADSSDLEADEPSWGIGATILTVLANAGGEERATHTQRTTYSAN